MKKYFNYAIIIEIICLLYAFIHNYYFMSQQIMFAAAILIMAISLFLYWQCFTNKLLSKQQKYMGLFFASIPLITIIVFGIFLFLYAKAIH